MMLWPTAGAVSAAHTSRSSVVVAEPGGQHAAVTGAGNDEPMRRLTVSMPKRSK
jgi:hypothetical protein